MIVSSFVDGPLERTQVKHSICSVFKKAKVIKLFPFPGVKPFVCNECGLQFANKSNWQRHVAEHSGSRNYPCHLCDKRFSRNYYLSDHLKTHTGEKPFVCGICGKSAATRSNYNSHLRTHITREPVNSEV